MRKYPAPTATLWLRGFATADRLYLSKNVLYFDMQVICSANTTCSAGQLYHDWPESAERERGNIMSEVAYLSRVRIERVKGPLRRAYLPAETEPVLFGVHGAVAAHYGVSPEISEPHATTLDYIVAAAAG